MHEYGIKSRNTLEDMEEKFDAVVLTVSHDEFLNIDLSRYLKEEAVVYDVKGILEKYDNRL